MDKDLLTHLERIAKGVTASFNSDDRAIAADSMHALGIEDAPRKVYEHEIETRFHEMINDCHSTTQVFGVDIDLAKALQDQDPVAYNMAWHEYTSDTFVESPTIPDAYYDNDDLEELRNNADDVFSEVKDRLLEEMDENSHDHKLVNDATDFENLVSVCQSIHQRDELRTEIASFAPATASLHEPANDERVERRVRRM